MQNWHDVGYVGKGDNIIQAYWHNYLFPENLCPNLDNQTLYFILENISMKSFFCWKHSTALFFVFYFS